MKEAKVRRYIDYFMQKEIYTIVIFIIIPNLSLCEKYNNAMIKLTNMTRITFTRKECHFLYSVFHHNKVNLKNTFSYYN